MKIIISIILNAFILFLIAFLLSSNEAVGIANGVILGCGNCSYFS